ncbi:MAG: DUF2057 domain-containing protein [Planctomycetes bacterium]|nr:DUF2057 domain-containing protein [Planctomycetota bacterium]
MPLRTLALVVFALLAACSGPRHSLGLPAEQVAVVKGASANGLQPFGVDATFRVTSVDGKELERSWSHGYPEIVELLPGRHELGIKYSSWIDGSVGPEGNATVAFDALAGRTYRIQFGRNLRPMIVTEHDGK